MSVKTNDICKLNKRLCMFILGLHKSNNCLGTEGYVILRKVSSVFIRSLLTFENPPLGIVPHYSLRCGRLT